MKTSALFPCPALFGAALLFLATPFSQAAPAGVVFEDDFSSRDNWITGGASETLTADNNVLTQQLDATVLFLSYLTENPGETIDLEVGQSLRVTYSVSFANLGSGAYYRFGLLDTSRRPRLTGDGVDGGFISPVTSDSFRESRGYVVWTNGQSEGTQVSVRRRTGADSPNSMNAAGQYFTASGTGTINESLEGGTIYHGTFEIFHNGENNMQFAAAKWRLNEQNEKIYLYDFTTNPDTSATTYSPHFDLLGFASSLNVADAISLHSIKVEVVEAAWVSEYTALDAPFDLDFGTSEGKEDGSLLLRSRVQDFSAQADSLRFSPASDVFVSSGALAVVANYQDGQNFTLETALTVQGLAETGANRVGLAVLGGPHMEDGIPFNIVNDEGFYGLVWYPVEADGASSLRIHEGFNGELLAEEPWLGKVPEVQGTTVLFEDDFEDPFYSAGAWTRSGDGLWEFGIPFAGPQSAVSGTQVAATSLNSQYPSNTDSWLRTPAIDLTVLQQATLQFWEYTDVDTEGVDFHSTTVSILDAGTLQLVEGGELSKNADKTANWRFRELDLPPDAMGREIVVEFRLRSDAVAGWSHDGWYLDDVRVTTPFIPDPSVFQMRATGVFDSSGALEISFTLTDEDDFSHTVSTVVSDPMKGNLFGIGGRSRTVEAGTPLHDFIHLSMEVGDGPPVGTGFAAWQATVFDADQLADESISGPGAAPAGDGFPNFLKYAFGLAPFVPAVLSDVIESGRMEGKPTLAYLERVGAGDVEYQPEVSTDLAVWHSGVEEIGRETLPGGQFERVTVRAVLDGAPAKAFLRVKILSK